MPFAPNRHWFRFSLRTLFVVVTVAATAGYWITQEFRAWSAARAWQRAADGYEAEVVTTYDLCRASRDLLNAELAVPFARRAVAANAHLARMEALKRKWDDVVCRMLSDSREREEAEVSGYYDEAKQIAAGYR